MSGLTGDLSSLTKFSAALRRLPTVVAQRVAERAAPELTEAALSTFNASQDAFGTPWDAGRDGRAVKLRQTGNLAKYIRYVAIGTKLRVSLGVSYAKYQVSRRAIFPKQGEPLPATYVNVLKRVASDVIRAEFAR